jgi:hypothetical protein
MRRTEGRFLGVHDPTTSRPEPQPARLDAWRPWTPDDVARVLAGVDAPWYVAAGWAMSLFLGEMHRAHEDIEIAVPASRFGEVVDALSDYDLFVPGQLDGEDLVWPVGSDDAGMPDSHQTWVREPATGHWKLDVFREPSLDGAWVCRRDESIRLPYERVVTRTDDGIPYVRPEIALLFKAKHVRPKDDADFAVIEPRLDDRSRMWLADTIERVHPGHDWVGRLR